jgi:hypothetical protein
MERVLIEKVMQLFWNTLRHWEPFSTPALSCNRLFGNSTLVLRTRQRRRHQSRLLPTLASSIANRINPICVDEDGKKALMTPSWFETPASLAPHHEGIGAPMRFQTGSKDLATSVAIVQ